MQAENYAKLSQEIDEADTFDLFLGQKHNVIGHTAMVIRIVSDRNKNELFVSFDVTKRIFKKTIMHLNANNWNENDLDETMANCGTLASFRLDQESHKAKEVVSTCLEVGNIKYHFLVNNCRHYVKKCLSALQKKHLISESEFKTAKTKVTIIQVLDKLKVTFLPVYVASTALDYLAMKAFGSKSFREYLKIVVEYISTGVFRKELEFPKKFQVEDGKKKALKSY